MNFRSESTETRFSRPDTAPALVSAAPCRRLLGGEQRLDGKPRQGRQPPEAGAAGPPLRGLPCSHTGPPRSTAGHREAALFAVPAWVHVAASNVRTAIGSEAVAYDECRAFTFPASQWTEARPPQGRRFRRRLIHQLHRGRRPSSQHCSARQRAQSTSSACDPYRQCQSRARDRATRRRVPCNSRTIWMWTFGKSIARNRARIAVTWHAAECLFDRSVSSNRAPTTKRRGTAR